MLQSLFMFMARADRSCWCACPCVHALQVPRWDTSKLRAKGARLKTFGGRASGPEPLEALFLFAVNLFRCVQLCWAAVLGQYTYCHCLDALDDSCHMLARFMRAELPQCQHVCSGTATRSAQLPSAHGAW